MWLDCCDAKQKKQTKTLLIPALPPAMWKAGGKGGISWTMAALPPANKGSWARILCHLLIKTVGKEFLFKKIKIAFATYPSRQSAKKFYYKKIRKVFPDCRVVVGKRDALRHFTTAYVPFADCHTGRWQRLCRLLFTWQVAKVFLPMNSLPCVLCRLPRVK